METLYSMLLWFRFSFYTFCLFLLLPFCWFGFGIDELAIHRSLSLSLCVREWVLRCVHVAIWRTLCVVCVFLFHFVPSFASTRYVRWNFLRDFCFWILSFVQESTEWSIVPQKYPRMCVLFCHFCDKRNKSRIWACEKWYLPILKEKKNDSAHGFAFSCAPLYFSLLLSFSFVQCLLCFLFLLSVLCSWIWLLEFSFQYSTDLIETGFEYSPNHRKIKGIRFECPSSSLIHIYT